MDNPGAAVRPVSRWTYLRGVAFKVAVGALFLAMFGLCVGAAQERFGGWGIVITMVTYPIFVFGCLTLHSAWSDRRARAVIRRSLLTPQRTLTGGDRVAVSGVIKVSGTPLEAPFSGAACAAYSYRVSGTVEHYRDGDRRSSMQNSLLGFHMLPAEIQSEGLTLRLLALPEAEAELLVAKVGGEWGAQARARLDAPERDGESVTAEPDAFAALFAARESAASPLAQDFLINRVGNASSSLTVEEEYLPVGEQLCLLGCYEALEQGLSGRRASDGRTGITFYRGSAAEVIERLGQDSRRSVITGLCLVVLGGCASFWPVVAQFTWGAA